MTLGERIQRGRKEAGLSQEELAELLGVSRQAVSKWENDSGYPEMEKMIRLSQIYQVSLDYLVGNEHGLSDEGPETKGWYISHELAENFLTFQSRKFKKAGICFLMVCVSGAFLYFSLYTRVYGTLSNFFMIGAIVMAAGILLSDNPYKKVWAEPLVFDMAVLKRLRVEFAENKRKYRGMMLGGLFVFLSGFLFLPDFYWMVPENMKNILYASGEALQGIGGYFAIYGWGKWRAYNVLTRNEEYWRKKKK